MLKTPWSCEQLPPKPPFGVEITRGLKKEEVELLEAMWAHFGPLRLLEERRGPSECCWFNLFQRGQWLNTFGDRQAEVEALVQHIAEEQCPYYEKLHCTSVSLFMSPPGCVTQFWHVDYTGTETNICLTMTPWTEQNGMEFMKGEISDDNFERFRNTLRASHDFGDGLPEFRSNAGLLKLATRTCRSIKHCAISTESHEWPRALFIVGSRIDRIM